MSMSAPARSARVAVCRQCSSWSIWKPCISPRIERSRASIRSGTSREIVVEVRLDVRHVLGAELGHARPDRAGERRGVGPVSLLMVAPVVLSDGSWVRSSIAGEPVGQAADGAGDAGAERPERRRCGRRFVEVDAEAGRRRARRACRRRSRRRRARRRCRTAPTRRRARAGTRSCGSPGRWRRGGGWRPARSGRRTRAARRARRSRPRPRPSLAPRRARTSTRRVAARAARRCASRRSPR